MSGYGGMGYGGMGYGGMGYGSMGSGYNMGGGMMGSMMGGVMEKMTYAAMSVGLLGQGVQVIIEQNDPSIRVLCHCT